MVMEIDSYWVLQVSLTTSFVLLRVRDSPSPVRGRAYPRWRLPCNRRRTVYLCGSYSIILQKPIRQLQVRGRPAWMEGRTSAATGGSAASGKSPGSASRYSHDIHCFPGTPRLREAVDIMLNPPPPPILDLPSAIAGDRKISPISVSARMCLRSFLVFSV